MKRFRRIGIKEAMGLPTVKNFLFCLQLETGGLILGWLGTILGGLAVLSMAFLCIISIIGIPYVDKVTDNPSYDTNGLSPEATRTVLISK